MLNYFQPSYLQICPVLDDKYKIILTIGEGRYSKVKLAFDFESNKLYACKILRKELCFSQETVETFVQEAEILSKMSFDHIIKIKYLSVKGLLKRSNGKTDSIIYYLMEFAENGDLFSFCQNSKKFPEKLARHYFHQLIEG